MPPEKRPDENGNWECGMCKEWKPPKSFNKDQKKKNGLRTYCRKCELVWHRQYVINKKEQEIHIKSISLAIAEYLETHKWVRDIFLRHYARELEPLIVKHRRILGERFKQKQKSNRKGYNTKQRQNQHRKLDKVA